ncbi:hypothetical protein Tco_0812620 [Tanacetum coccineum]
MHPIRGGHIHDIVLMKVSPLENVQDAEMFDVNDLHGDEVFVKKEVLLRSLVVVMKVTTAGEVVTTANVEVSTTSPTEATIADELTLAQTLIEIKSAKPKVKGVACKRERDPKEQEANVSLIEEWNDIQAKIEADQLLAERLQAREQEELTIEERAKLF